MSTHPLIAIAILIVFSAQVLMGTYYLYQRSSQIREERKERKERNRARIDSGERRWDKVFDQIPKPALQQIMSFLRKFADSDRSTAKKAMRFTQEKILDVHLRVREKIE